MIETIYFDGKKPAIAYTDFTAIYISRSLTGSQLETAIKHEKGHIWLNHNNRFKAIKDINFMLANIAADLEIAYHLYDQDDLDAIEAPRSLLKGGISKKHCEEYPSCKYMEEFYQELLKKKNKLKSHDGHANKDKDDKEDKGKDKTAEQLVEDAKKEIQKQKNKTKAKKLLEHFNPPKPSLASELMATFGRNKIKHVRSYRNPDEFEESDFFIKGWVVQKRKPKLNIFVDRSGSFCPDKTAKATSVLDKCLKKFRGKINKDVFYFNNGILLKDPMRGDGGTNYEAVIDIIKKDKAEMSIIITDDDYCACKSEKIDKTIVIPIGCSKTKIANVFGLTEVFI